MAQHPVDVHVGRRLRSRRTMLGMSQENLGDAVGVTFQQIQKYEKGLNRIGSSRLFEFSRTLNVSVSYFFEDFYETSGNTSSEVEENTVAYEAEALANKEVLALVRAYSSIEDEVVRKKVLGLVKSLNAFNIEEPVKEETRGRKPKASLKIAN
jgi:transcriptional regulator with XRE-family HTH domain